MQRQLLILDIDETLVYATETPLERPPDFRVGPFVAYRRPHLHKFIEAKGEGIQHIAYRVENIEEALAELKAKGVRLIDEKPRKGAGGAKIAFIHPKATGGILVELCERS